MSALLLAVIYITYIGLGLPDSLFGAAWPAVYTEFGLPISAANVATILTFAFTMIVSLYSAQIVKCFGTPLTTAVSTAMTAVGLLGTALAPNFFIVCLCTVPLGFGAGAIDAALNNYVALNYKATHMNFLHCFYGVGVSLSPYLMSLALKGQNWRGGYAYATVLQVVITIITFLALPVWAKVSHSETEEKSGEEIKTLGIWQMLKMPKVRMACAVFMTSCGIEYTCGTWGSTFLVLAKGMSAQRAAATITFYYLGITIGRFLSGIIAAKLSSRRIIILGQCIVLLAIILLFLPLSYVFAALGLFLVGLGNGPLYPNLVHLTPDNFGRGISQSVMGIQMATASIGIMLIPPLFGLIAQVIGTWIFPLFLLILFIIMIVENTRLNRCRDK